MTSKFLQLKETGYKNYLNSIKNRVYKLLPLREEGTEWKKHLETLLYEVMGLNDLLGEEALFISLIAKLQSLNYVQLNFALYRKTIFECLSIIEGLDND